jgi:NitT/TauT family transport system substrate-binding protein
MAFMNRRAALCGTLSALGAIAVYGASGNAADAPLRVASNLGDPYSEAYFGKDGGFFDKAGLSNIDYQIINQGGTMAAAVVGGSLDIAITTPIQIANAHLRNLPLIIIAAGCISTPKAPASPLYVARTSAISEAKDLVGKRVGLNGLRALSEVALDTWLDQHGVDVKQVHPVEVTFGEMGTAITRGTIDAAMIAEPAASMSAKANDLRILADPYQSISPQTLVSCWFTTTGFAKMNPDIVRRFASAIYQTARWANTHRDETARILAKYAHIDIAAVRATVRSEYAESFRPDDLQRELDAATAAGLLPQRLIATDLIYRI